MFASLRALIGRLISCSLPESDPRSTARAKSAGVCRPFPGSGPTTCLTQTAFGSGREFATLALSRARATRADAMIGAMSISGAVVLGEIAGRLSMLEVYRVRRDRRGRRRPAARLMQEALEVSHVEFFLGGAIRLRPDPITFGRDYLADRYRFRPIANRRGREIVVDVSREALEDGARLIGAQSPTRRALSAAASEIQSLCLARGMSLREKF
jgi:hypothetical protein